MEKLKVHIDPKHYSQKPSGNEIAGIKSRLREETTQSTVSLKELAEKICHGHTVSPAVMRGMSAADWQEQQLFLVDIDNECDEMLARRKGCTVEKLPAKERTPILSVENALNICKEQKLPVAFYYHTFGSSNEKLKFRLGFVMEQPVKNPMERQRIIKTLVSLFPQSDKSCINADRMFFGTNSEVVICDSKARITIDAINYAFPQPDMQSTQKSENSPVETYDTELEELKRNFEFLPFLKERNGECKLTPNGAVFKNCEICGHHNDLVYYSNTNTFYCFSSSGKIGGSIIDYLIKVENLTVSQAIDKFKYELCGLERKEFDWKNPVPLREDLALPQFPVNCLPKALKEWVLALAENTFTAVDMAGIASLAILSTSLQGKFDIMGNDNYFEPLNLYILLIAKSGERKSPIVRQMTRVIYQYENEENAKRQPKIDAQETELRVKYNLAEQFMKKGKTEEAIKLKAECREIEKNMLKPLRLIADDITPEALASLLADCDGRLSIYSTEGGLFDTLAGRYSNNPFIDTVLKAHCGDPIRVDRKGHPCEYINSPALTMLLSAQENVLDGLLGNDVFKSRGLTARILYSKPKSLIGTRILKTPAIPEDIENGYNELVLKLLNIPFPKNAKPNHLMLEESASHLLEKFFDWVEPQLVGDLENMEGWGEKFIGTTLRIAGLLHCAEHKSDSAHTLVSLKTLKKAIKIGKYFLKHAQYTFSLMGADKALQGAKQIVKKLKTQSSKELSKYQIFRLCRGSFAKADDALPSLELLVEYGYLKEQVNGTPTGGRPRASTYILNPKFFDS